jgi:hypothetical protein
MSELISHVHERPIIEALLGRIEDVRLIMTSVLITVEMAIFGEVYDMGETNERIYMHIDYVIGDPCEPKAICSD